MTEEARLVPAEEGGVAPEGDGWFVLNAKDARWLDGELGKYTGFEGRESRFPQLGINLNVMRPGRADDDVPPRGRAGGLPRARRRVPADRRTARSGR